MNQTKSKNQYPKFPNRKYRLLLDAEEHEKQEQEIKNWVKEDLEKLEQLRRLYKIKDAPGWELALAMELARKFYPEDTNKRGRPTKWDDWKRAALAVEHRRLKLKTGYNDREVCNLLRKREPWLSFLETKNISIDGLGEDPAEALHKQLKKAKSHFVEASWKAYCWDEHHKALNDWDEYLLALLKNNKID